MHKQGVWDSQCMCPVYQGVLISGCLDKRVPLYIHVRVHACTCMSRPEFSIIILYLCIIMHPLINTYLSLSPH